MEKKHGSWRYLKLGRKRFETVDFVLPRCIFSMPSTWGNGRDWFF